MLVALDFAPGLHGHFLEFVVNKFIYGVKYNDLDIFQSSGAAHAINVNDSYQSTKIVHRAHYSSFTFPYPRDTTAVIFIDHRIPDLDIVLLTNIYHRCHPNSMESTDFNVEEIKQMHRQFLLTNSDLESRNNWFAKLNERHFDHAFMQPKTNLPVFYFNYASFFNLLDFYLELKRLSKFLNETFTADDSLAQLWSEFILKNQGWTLYNLGNSLLESALFGGNKQIPDDWKLHAYLNFKLSKIFDLYSGVLHTDKNYPSTTSELKLIIDDHVKNFDNQW